MLVFFKSLSLGVCQRKIFVIILSVCIHCLIIWTGIQMATSLSKGYPCSFVKRTEEGSKDIYQRASLFLEYNGKNSFLLCKPVKFEEFYLFAFHIFFRTGVFYSSLSHVIFQSQVGRHSHNKCNMHAHTHILLRQRRKAATTLVKTMVRERDCGSPFSCTIS